MMNCDFRAIGDGDVEQWCELTNLLAAVDATGEFYEPEDLAEELAAPTFDAALDSLGAWDGNRLVGFVQIDVAEALREGKSKGAIMGGVHPDFRRRGLGTRLMEYAETRVVELAASLHPGVELTVDLHANLDIAGADVLARNRHYLPVRYFQQMGMDLSRRDPTVFPTPNAAMAALIRQYSSDYAEGVRDAHNEAFADHWGSTARSKQRWATYTSARSFRPEFGRMLVEAPDTGEQPGKVRSYVMSSEWVAGEIYIDLVGTRRADRGLGLASVLLAEVLAAAATAGYQRAEL